MDQQIVSTLRPMSELPECKKVLVHWKQEEFKIGMKCADGVVRDDDGIVYTSGWIPLPIYRSGE